VDWIFGSAAARFRPRQELTIGRGFPTLCVLSAMYLKEWLRFGLSGLNLRLLQIDVIHMEDEPAVVVATISIAESWM
jgi:hypothetical protein